MRSLDRRPTVVLADDHARVLSRVGELLADECNVVAGVSDGIKVVQAALKYKPDIVVLDIAMPGLDGIQAAREVRRFALPARLIFLTVQEDADYIRAAQDLGASYVVKRRMHIDLPLAIKEALAGRMFFSPRVLTHSRAI
ncbi:MAG TPA: response regulator transcription factor [Terriglobales bacterium]|nr:response regulator transcription factor [Terriglobales bacterium]